MPQKKVIIIAGPTAVGKTSVAIEVAQRLGTSIVSADSRQCYREMNIGVARPTPEELAAVPHYFIASHSIYQPVDVAIYERYALQCLEDVFEKNDTAVVAGGTGLYIKALCEGVDEMPDIPEAIRTEVRGNYEQYGLPWLQQQISQLDAVYAATGETQNPHRMMRALEFVMATGQSIRSWQKGAAKKRPFDVLKIGLELPRELLNERIHLRVDDMMAQGQVEEANGLLPFQHLKALQTVGYRELFDHFNGLSSLTAAIEFIKTNTRQYAKRQMTWFKKDQQFNWYSPRALDAIQQRVDGFISSK